MELNKIYNQDCIEYMKTLPNGCVDLIIADPPYFRIVKEKWDNQWKTEEEYYSWCSEWIGECFRILKPNGSLYIWNWFDNICEVGHIAKRSDFNIRNLITWCRGGGRENNNFRSQSEYLLYLTKGEKPVFNIGDILLNPYDECRRMTKQAWERGKYERKNRPNYNEEPSKPSNVWWDSFVSKQSKENVGHPTQKPLNICDRIIKASSNKGQTVYIPFAGSGSEIVSCIKNNRNYIATETNKEYIEEIINKRIVNTYRELNEMVG